MPLPEYLGWQEFYLMEPWGLRPQDIMHAHVLSILANINRNKEVRPDPYEIKDFMLFDKAKQPAVDPKIDGKTCEEWKLIFAAEALAAQRSKPLQP